MVNLLEQAINSDDGDRAAKVIQDTRHRIGRCRQLGVSENLAARPRAAWPVSSGVAIATTLTARSKSPRARC
jgi:hypothetical protein